MAIDIPDDIYEAAVLYGKTKCPSLEVKESSHSKSIARISAFCAGAMWERGLVCIDQQNECL